MKLKDYLKDKFLSIVIFIISYLIILMFLIVFKVRTELIIAITFIFFSLGIILILIDIFKKKKFYDNFLNNLTRLDQKYLVIETLEKPNFYEGKLLYDSFYEINKSMLENLKKYEMSINDFKEYIEMWIHEVKIPIATLVLLSHNKEKIPKKYSSQIRKLDSYIDQVLYYVRSENTEKDYLIKEIQLDKIVNNVALKNKDDLLENKVQLIVSINNEKVLTDSKWLEFILNQIINNSIKYKKEEVDSIIKIFTEAKDNHIILNIYDNGIGIPRNDLGQVFKKTFTGENGRIKTKSTGMGLYIAKNLCQKLGHKIEIDSVVNEYTCIKITFNINDFYKIKN